MRSPQMWHTALAFLSLSHARRLTFFHRDDRSMLYTSKREGVGKRRLMNSPTLPSLNVSSVVLR